MQSNSIPTRTLVSSFFLLFFLKLLFAYGFCTLLNKQMPDRRIGSFSIASGDYVSYLGAMENYVKTTKYYFVNQSRDTVLAGRPPHYTIPYLAGRSIGSREFAADLMTIFYLLLDCFAILCVSLIASQLVKFPRQGFLIAMVLGLISTYVSNWTFITVPDSGGAALLMIGCYFYWLAYNKTENLLRNIFFSSFFFSWAIMLRPYLVLVVGLFAILYLIRKRPQLRTLFKIGIAAVLPTFFVIFPWVIRNYKELGRLIPFQENVYAGYGYIPSEVATRRLMTTLGEDGGTFWDPHAMASWFSPAHYESSRFRLPNYIKRDSFLHNSILTLRHDYISTYNRRSDEQELELKARSAMVRRYYNDNYTCRSYFLNPIKRLAMFWGHSGSYYISAKNGPKVIVMIVKVSQSTLYFLVLIMGTIGLWIGGRKDESMRIFLIPLALLSLMFPMVLGFMEPRYAMAFYYPGLLGLVLFLSSLINRFGYKARLSKI